MALTDDQKAMLRLLAQREEGYEDIAALMGLSVDEVRARVKEALTELNSGQGSEGSAVGPVAAGDPPPPPVAKASSGAVPPAAPPAGEAAEPAVEEPAAPAPISPASSERRTEATKHRPRPSLSGVKLPKDRGALIGLGAGAAVVVILVIVLILGGGGEDSDAPATTGSSSETATTTGEDQKLTQAILEPADGGDASGRAIFGRLKNNVLLQVQADGLEPTAEGQSYSVWLYRSPKLALRVGAVAVDDSGKIAVQIPIPAEVLAYVAGGAFGQIDISLTDDAAYKAEVARAKSQGRLPRYSGTSVLRGEITGPAIKAASGN